MRFIYPDRTVTPEEAVNRGSLLINGAVGVLLLGPGTLFLFGPRIGLSDPRVQIGLAALVPVCWVFAWLSWSVLVPKWRLWAYANVDDLDNLKSQAVTARLLWPEGHLFQRTEIMSAETRRKIADLEAAKAKS